MLQAVRRGDYPDYSGGPILVTWIITSRRGRQETYQGVGKTEEEAEKLWSLRRIRLALLGSEDEGVATSQGMHL